MIRHIVMFQLPETLTPSEKALHLQTAADMTAGFLQEISSLADFKLVTNSDLAPASNYDLALICDFNTIDDLNKYQEHPSHKKFGSFITKVRQNRACIDYEY